MIFLFLLFLSLFFVCIIDQLSYYIVMTFAVMLNQNVHRPACLHFFLCRHSRTLQTIHNLYVSVNQKLQGCDTVINICMVCPSVALN